MSIAPRETEAGVVLRFQSRGEQVRVVTGMIAGEECQPFKLNRETPPL